MNIGVSTYASEQLYISRPLISFPLAIGVASSRFRFSGHLFPPLILKADQVTSDKLSSEL